MSDDPTNLLNRSADGDRKAADRLVPLVYDELRGLASSYLTRERPDHTLQPTALVNEAYIKLVGQERVDWRGRTHFFAVAANAMRRILVDHARGRGRAKRGAGYRRVGLEAIGVGSDPSLGVLELEDVLSRYAEIDPRAARVVELRFFAGMTIEETAVALGVSPRTVRGDWKMARAWIAGELDGSDRDR